MVPQQSQLMILLDRREPINNMRKAPSSGRAGTNQTASRNEAGIPSVSPFQQVDFVRIDSVAVAEESDQDS